MYINFKFVHTLNRGEKMKTRRLKKPVVYLLYGLGFVLLVGVAFSIENLFTKKSFDDDLTYVSKTVFDKVIPVVTEDYKIIKPISFIYSILITVGFSIIVNIATYFSLKKIDMIESLKSVE